MTFRFREQLTKREFESLSELRYQIRRFLRFSEHAVRDASITPLQYLLLLHLRGFPGREWATIGEIAERLQAKHHGVVALVSRCEALGLVTKKRGRADRREIHVHLSAKGMKTLNKLAMLHHDELRSLRDAFEVHALSAFNDTEKHSLELKLPRSSKIALSEPAMETD
jgi:DNA-binding MarR family transcriptional regulator